MARDLRRLHLWVLLAMGPLGACRSAAPGPDCSASGESATIGVLPSPIVLFVGNATIAESRERFTCGGWGSPVAGTWTTTASQIAAVAGGVAPAETVFAVAVGSAQVHFDAPPDSVSVGVIVVPIPPVERFVAIRAGEHGSCAISSNGALYCWGVSVPVACRAPAGAGPECGVGGEAPSGDESTVTRSTCEAGAWCSRVPVLAPGVPPLVSVGGGGIPACGLTAEGAAACWRDGFFVSSIAGAVQFRQVSSSSDHACAVGVDDRAYCWGANEVGQLGDGTTLASSTPVRVSGDLAVRAISVGGRHTCAVTTDDQVYCWGGNYSGAVGAPAPDRCTVGNYPYVFQVECATHPLLVSPSLRFRSVTAGVSSLLEGHTCAVALDGTGYCWGSNYAGQLGQGDTVARLSPSPVAGSLNFDSISAGGGQTCGLSAGGAYCWGDYAPGVVVTVPVRVGPGLAFMSVDAGGTHSCGVTTTGLGYCWGYDDYGQLGIGGRTAGREPVPVAGQQ